MNIGAKIGFRLLVKQKRKTLLSTTCVAIGMSLIFFLGVTTDAVEQRYNALVKYQFGNIDYTAFDTGSIGTSNTFNPRWLPVSALSTIQTTPGVVSATYRSGGVNTWYHDEDIPETTTSIYGIPVNNSQEKGVGIAIVTDCLPSIGTPSTVTVEDLLATTAVDHPAVISKEASSLYGLSVLDTIKIDPENATKAYATPAEILAATTPELKAQLEAAVSNNLTRFVNFTIVGIVVDGSESTEQPFPVGSSSINEIFPNLLTIYLNTNDTWHYAFNDHPNQCTYFAIDTGDGFSATSLESSLSALTGRDITVQDIASAFMAYSSFIMWVIRIALLMLGTLIAMLGATLIQSNINTNIKSVYKDLGILKGNGYTNKVLTGFMLSQVLPTAILGVGMAYGIGIIPALFFNPTQMISLFVSKMTFPVSIIVPLFVSWQSIAITAGAGIILPLVFAFVGIKDTRKIQALEMMKPELLLSKTKWTSDKKAISAIRVAVLAASLVAFYYSATSIFGGTLNHVDLSKPATLVGVFVLVVSFFVAVMDVSIIVANAIKYVVHASARVTRKHMQVIGRKMTKANVKSIKTVAKNMVVASLFIVFITSVIHSMYIGQMKDARTTVGGDIIMFNPLLSMSNATAIAAEVPGVEHATVIGYASMESWRTNKALTGFAVNKIDDYGGDVHDNVPDPVNVVIIDPSSYLDVNDNPDARFIFDGMQSTRAFIGALDTPGTMIVQKDLVNDIGKRAGDTALLNLMGIRSNLAIAGTATLVPGAPSMFMYAAGPSRTVVISQSTFQKMLDEFTGDVDIVIKNKTINASQFTNKTIPPEFLGYASGQIKKSNIEPIETITGVQKVSYRFSTFSPFAPQLLVDMNHSRFLQDDGSETGGSHLYLPNRVYLFDSTDEFGMTSDSGVLEAHSFINTLPFKLPWESWPRIHNDSVSEILYGYDNYLNWNLGGSSTAYFGNNSICVVNKHVAMYNTTTGSQSYVYENKVGDNITVNFPGASNTTIPFNFTVVGTIDNHVAYTYQNGTKQPGFSLSGKTLNYNFNAATTKNATYFESFDVDGNVFLTTYTQLQHVYYVTSGFPFGYNVNDVMNHVYVKISSTANVNTVVDEIKTMIGATANNYSVIAYKQTLFDKLVNTGALSIKIDGSMDKPAVIANLRQWIVDHGLEWDSGSVVTIDDWVNLGSLKDVIQIFSILMVFAMIIASLGLAQTIYEVLRERHREYAMLRCIGYSKKDVKGLVFNECFVITFACAMIGMVAGMLLGYLLFSGMSVPLVVAMYYEVDIATSIALAISLVGISVTSSLAIASRISAPEPIESLRSI